MKRPSSKAHPLVGKWRGVDEFSSVEYSVSKSKSGYLVVALDTFDKEIADVFEQKWEPATGILSFATHWNSTGRFVRCRLQAISIKQVSLTYTYTDMEMLVPANKRKA